MSDHEVKMIILSTDDLDESIKFYGESLGMTLKFRDGAHFAALDGGPVTLALATESIIRFPDRSWSGSRPPTSTRPPRRSRPAVAASSSPYDDAHERRAVVYDNKGNAGVLQPACALSCRAR